MRSIGLAESKRGRRVCCMIMSSGVVGMNGNNRASLCYSPCPSCTQRANKLFPIAPPHPHPPPRPPPKKNSFISTDTSCFSRLHIISWFWFWVPATGFSLIPVCKRKHSKAWWWLCDMRSKPFYTVYDHRRLPQSIIFMEAVAGHKHFKVVRLNRESTICSAISHNP